MGFDWILGSQGNTTEDDEDENEVREVGMMDEIVAGDSQTENGEKVRREVDYLSGSSTENHRGIKSASPVFLPENKEGASIRDWDNLFFGPRKLGL